MMNLLLIRTLLFSGLCTISSSSVPRQFHVVKEQKTWTEAQQYCREKFTDLATIDNMAEMEKVKSLIKEAAAGRVWIGLKKGSSPKWQWSLADREFYGENEAQFQNWGNNQPDGGNNEIYVTMMNGQWHDVYRNNQFTFICYDGGNSTHPYVLVNEKKTWTDAQRYCRENHTDLVSVKNQAENDQINDVGGNTDVWIGLFRDAWEWSDGSSSSFRHWGRGEPNNEGVICTDSRLDGLWDDVHCHRHRNFICYEDKLVLIRENKTWNEALEHCQNLNMGLVSVRSGKTQQWVTELVKTASTDHVWLGLRHACGVGWFWVWGETVCYDNWAEGQDQVQGCQGVGAVKAGADGGQWVSHVKENDKHNFICAIEDE